MLQKQPIDISFAKGLDLKTDPFRIAFGRFLQLRNSIFQKGGLLQKRNGFGALTSLPNSSYELLTTFNGNLTAIGQALLAYSQASQTWVSRGTIYPTELSVLSLIRSNTNQIYADSAVSSNGLVCTVYGDSFGDPLGSPVITIKYAVADAITGQNLIAPTTLTEAAAIGFPKVFVLGGYFVIVYSYFNSGSGAYNLKYFAISTQTLAVGSAATASTAYSPVSSGGFDGCVVNNALYLSWNGNDGGGAIRMTYLDSTLTQHGTVSFAGKAADFLSVTADITGSTAIVYVSFYKLAGTAGYTLAVSQSLVTILAPTQIIAAGTIQSMTSSAQSGLCTVFYETTNAVNNNFVTSRTVTQAGVLGTATVRARGVGLASKSFIIDSNIYFLSVYSSSYQPTYFLLNASGQVLSKLAYSNAGQQFGYLAMGLPNVSVLSGVAYTPYLIKDLVVPVNKVQAASVSAAIYAQAGINLAAFTISTDAISFAETAKNLHFSGGFLWMYDGYLPVEHNFHLWPDVTATMVAATANLTGTGDTSNGSPNIANLSIILPTGLSLVGMTISGTGIPADTTVLSAASTSLILSKNATATNTGVTFTFKGSLSAQDYYYQATYEWTDNQGNIHRSAPSVPQKATADAGHTFSTISVPTLRLTYKIANPVKIVLYRWSTAQPVYYQATSVTSPLLNSTTVDSVTFYDIQSDAQIIGNSIIYTTGGVVENIAAPACRAVDLFDNRLWFITSEDENLLGFSKQVIEGVPVEPTDLFTMFVPPTTASEGSTGPMKCLAPLDDKQIIFKPSAIYYINGKGPDNTGASNQYSDPIFITSTVGTSNQRSIVFQPEGLMFQADGGKGIWILGRDLSTKYIGADVEDFNSATVLSAINIPGTNQVRFTLDNGVTLMYDYYYGQWGSFVNVPAISATVYESLHTYIDSYGRVFQETPGLYLDGASPTLLSFTTGWVNLAGLQGFERAYFFYLLGTYLSPHKLTIGIAYDYNPAVSQQLTITPDNYTAAWGGGGTTLPGSNPPWGSDGSWGGNGAVEQWRVFLQQQKCQSFQISIQESYDPAYGVSPGAGLTLSGLNLIVGVKKGYPTLKAAKSAG